MGLNSDLWRRLAVAVTLAATGCTSASGSRAPACLTVTASCSPPPSYSMDIAPLMQRACVPCHSPGGQAFVWDLTTHDNVIRLGSTVASQVACGIMPPADAGPDAALTAGERTELVDWVLCGGPNN